MEYPKTSNLFLRDPDDIKKLVVGTLDEETEPFAQVGKWHLTEKIDGTNIRLCLNYGEGSAVKVLGRSDNANLPGKGDRFVESALPSITATDMEMALREIDPEGYASGMIVYGEGFGPGIQKGGGAYSDHMEFAAFDVLTLAQDREPLWRSWRDVVTVCDVLGLNTVPVLSDAADIEQITSFVQQAPRSLLNDHEALMEGVVARTDPYLYTSRGRRVKFKLKVADIT